MSNFCNHCGTAVSPNASACPSCGEPLGVKKIKAARKSKIITIILGLMFGMFGAHRFYLRDFKAGAVILALCLIFAFEPSGVLLTLAGVAILIDVIVLVFRGREFYEAKAQQ